MKPHTSTPPSVETLTKIEQFFGLSEPAIDHQIDEHKYFLNLSIDHEISRQEALDSWAQNIFEPLLRAIDEEHLEQAFPDLGLDELFIRVSDHWYFLKRDEDPNLSARAAVLSFGALHATDALSRSDFYLKL